MPEWRRGGRAETSVIVSHSKTEGKRSRKVVPAQRGGANTGLGVKAPSQQEAGEVEEAGGACGGMRRWPGVPAPPLQPYLQPLVARAQAPVDV